MIGLLHRPLCFEIRCFKDFNKTISLSLFSLKVLKTTFKITFSKKSSFSKRSSILTALSLFSLKIHRQANRLISFSIIQLETADLEGWIKDKRMLNGIKVIELAGLAPAPFCGMVMADLGATVIRVDRVQDDGTIVGQPMDQLTRGKKSIAINLKQREGVALLADLCAQSDVLIDCYRPGVLEKLGLCPRMLLEKKNPRLIVARLTGYGQQGDYAKMAGHDINYIALSGALSLFGRKNEPPVFPANILGDFAGGGLLCAFGIVVSLYNRSVTGKGQIIDSSMMDGAAYLSTFVYKLKQARNGMWDNARGDNFLDTGAHYYEVYRTKDNKYISVGAIEPHFYATLIAKMGLSSEEVDQLPDQNDSQQWPAMKKRFQSIFETKTRDEWESIFKGTDACVAPVLEMDELHNHPHSSRLINNEKEINPAPRFLIPVAATKNEQSQQQANTIVTGGDTIQVLKDLYQYSPSTITLLIKSNIIGQEGYPKTSSL
ncbi:hypothetical protein DFA_07944 [Cavenderia fasciculata]|uniref:Alpha-methylacyl-CoA racemase n=1 Tax=Cavenderia fasciculata TaxID=261658 RepID=F4Q4A1_CACFS|nr:uncharacterized protein DFA_07944 [Cavenderia fasciculata]EGG16963.1 hypothetical protein DFA_07944 [Cavenderia fasciculata]|eukprot:XP_004355437.1 hypothetical protein DFA_07944 [Cavenderia fasciculata]